MTKRKVRWKILLKSKKKLIGWGKITQKEQTRKEANNQIVVSVVDLSSRVELQEDLSTYFYAFKSSHLWKSHMLALDSVLESRT